MSDLHQRKGKQEVKGGDDGGGGRCRYSVLNLVSLRPPFTNSTSNTSSVQIVFSDVVTCLYVLAACTYLSYTSATLQSCSEENKVIHLSKWLLLEAPNICTHLVLNFCDSCKSGHKSIYIIDLCPALARAPCAAQG